MAEYLAHYGVKGMKWHKHLMAKPANDISRRNLKDTVWDSQTRLETKIYYDKLVGERDKHLPNMHPLNIGNAVDSFSSNPFVRGKAAVDRLRTTKLNFLRVGTKEDFTKYPHYTNDLVKRKYTTAKMLRLLSEMNDSAAKRYEKKKKAAAFAKDNDKRVSP